MQADRSARAALLLLACACASDCPAAGFDCTDHWGHRYLTDRPLAAAGMSCVPFIDVPATDEQTAGRPQRSAPPRAEIESMFGFRDHGTSTAANDAAALALSARLAWTLRAPPAGSRGAELRSGLDPLIESVARAYGHDADLLRAIILVESRFNPNARSPKGAIGLMQVMPATAMRFGLPEAESALFEPETNLRIGAQYLRTLANLFPGRDDLVLAAYNAGEGAVLRHGGNVPPYRET